jgi:hypothetical protein
MQEENEAVHFDLVSIATEDSKDKNKAKAVDKVDLISKATDDSKDKNEAKADEKNEAGKPDFYIP